MKLGNVVYSKAGRDAGRAYLVIKEDEPGYVLVVDGEVRTLARPKRKNERHLSYKGEDLPVIAEKLTTGMQVFDSEIRSALRLFVK